MWTFQTLLCHAPQPHVLVVQFNRPDVANALNTQMGRDLHALFSELLLDTQDIRCVVLTGAGDRAFCAGGDLKERNGMSIADWRRQHALFEQAAYAMMDCPIPMIAAVNGSAFGGGCEFALTADFIYAARTARFSLPEPRLGIIPGCGGTQNLPRAVGARRAKELIFTAAAFTAQDAHDWGMVNAVCEPEDLMAKVMEVAGKIAANAPIAVRQAKRAISIGIETDLKTGLAVEVEAYNRAADSEDRLEGVAAFNEKRPPQFQGR